jgi:two-component system sensor histidine kinase UhpB
MFRVPLVYKILIANTVIVLLGALVGTAVTAEAVRAAPGRSILQLIAFFAAIGVLVSALLNAIILRLACSPIKLLHDAAERVQTGDLAARAPVSLLADTDLVSLTEAFNCMQDNLQVYQQRLRAMASRARCAEESERKRIASELHDDTAQTLAAVLLRLRLARNASDQQERDAQLDGIRSEIARVGEEIRGFARRLRPIPLDELGLIAAIESHVALLGDTTHLQVELEAEPVNDVLSPDVELALFRIVQEALTNVMRHAGARSARVAIGLNNEHVVASVSDDGKGFAADELDWTDCGLGFCCMRERAEYVGGSLDVITAPGEGTTIHVELPVETENASA